LADQLAKNGDVDGAITELRKVNAFEQIGDLEAARGRTAEARDAYEKALPAATDRKERKRIQQKLKR
jgi:predicted negative regulator of RcsB-dependent stress response